LLMLMPKLMLMLMLMMELTPQFRSLAHPTS
jgi:hypothetical protein